ncbi:MAG: cyclodeaminase/cyclohydrolase family protein [Oscillospiraceae bacterium]|nr:cyclodeaminase/cyclohydrolase family protein [Oscillospiraceae bacterium]
MAESNKIEIFRKKDADEFTKALADPDSRAQTGSGSAMTAAVASALLERAACMSLQGAPEDERLQYIVRNAEILRNYMVNLIDEDVKARGPYRSAVKDGDERKIEAATQVAGAVCSEIVGMMAKGLELMEELADRCPQDARHIIAESADLAQAAIRACMRVCVFWGDLSIEDTRRYVIRRENELQWEEICPRYERIVKKLS